MTVFHVVLALVALQRGGELLLARANTARLLAQGAVEIDRAGYKWFVVLHAGWLAALFALVPAATPPNWPLLAVFGMLQIGRVWVIASLGRRWTTRLIVPTGVTPVSAGPYRWLDHPNYLIVAGELAILPLAFAAVAVAVAFSACNAWLISRRIRLEDAALRPPSYHIPETLPRRNSL
jgi:methyltransferase